MTNEERLKRYERCKRDPFYSLRLVRTYDPHEENPDLLKYGKSFPWEKPAMEKLVNAWLKYRLNIIAKSRQQMLSWLFVWLHTWLMLTKPGQYIYFRSQKKNDAGLLKDPLSLLSRMKYIVDRLPREFLCCCFGKKFKFKRPFQGAEMGWEFPNKSVVMCVSRDPDDIRTPTANALLDDEDAFQEWKEEADQPVGALLGTTGKWTKISSANEKNYFYRKFNDEE